MPRVLGAVAGGGQRKKLGLELKPQSMSGNGSEAGWEAGDRNGRVWWQRMSSSPWHWFAPRA